MTENVIMEYGEKLAASSLLLELQQCQDVKGDEPNLTEHEIKERINHIRIIKEQLKANLVHLEPADRRIAETLLEKNSTIEEVIIK